MQIWWPPNKKHLKTKQYDSNKNTTQQDLSFQISKHFDHGFLVMEKYFQVKSMMDSSNLL